MHLITIIMYNLEALWYLVFGASVFLWCGKCSHNLHKTPGWFQFGTDCWSKNLHWRASQYSLDAPLWGASQCSLLLDGFYGSIAGSCIGLAADEHGPSVKLGKIDQTLTLVAPMHLHFNLSDWAQLWKHAGSELQYKLSPTFNAGFRISYEFKRPVPDPPRVPVPQVSTLIPLHFIPCPEIMNLIFGLPNSNLNLLNF